MGISNYRHRARIFKPTFISDHLTHNHGMSYCHHPGHSRFDPCTGGKNIEGGGFTGKGSGKDEEFKKGVHPTTAVHTCFSPFLHNALVY